ncbi:MFS transporter [Stappia taiwanensis]|nr:YbfB/YjiJ family MFS transporter [Stappia taiwanensis]GGE95486.1 MFS transporter [Stappia taiwanensis]
MSEAGGSPLRTALAGLFAMAAAMGIGRFALTPLLPFMIEGIPLSAAEGGLIASANYLGYLAGALAAMRGGTDHLRRGFFLALAASAVTSAVMGLGDSLLFLSLVRFAGGVASAYVLVFSSVLVLEQLAREGRPGLSAVHFAGVGLGIALSAAVVGTLSRLGVSWPGLWLSAGAVSALLCLLVGISLGAHRRAGGTRPPEGAASAARSVATGQGGNGAMAAPAPSAALLRLSLAYGLFGVGYVVTATFLTTILRTSEGLAALEAPIWALVGLCAAISILVWNRVAARIGGGRAFALACVLEAVGVVASVTVSGVGGFVLAAILFGSTFMGITALGLLEARRLSAANPRKALGVMTACFGAGQAIGPVLAGVGADLSGSFVLPSLAAAAALVLAAGLVGIGGEEVG